MFNFSHLLAPFFSTALIALDVDGRSCAVSVLVKKHGKVKEDFRKEFKCVNNELPIEAAKLIRAYKRKYPFTYLGVLAKTYNQGLASTTSRSKMAKFGINVNDSVIIKLDTWVCYIKKRAIDENRVRYLKALGLDYLFSPFLLIYSLVSNSLHKRNCLYILAQKNSITLLIADKSNVLFGGYFFLGNDLEVNPKEENLSEIHSMLDMKNIEGLIGSSVEELKEIGELEDINKEVLEEEFLPKEVQARKDEENKQSHLEELRDLARANNATEIIINCISEFYGNDIYTSDFLEKVVILDSYGISRQAIEHIKSTLLLDIEVKKIELTKSIIALMQKESR